MEDSTITAIAEFRRIESQCLSLFLILDQNQCDASKEHGHRPWPWISWRKYEHIEGTEIEKARDEFLLESGANAQQIEFEYRAAKDREAAQIQLGKDWDKKAGLVEQRADYDRLDAAVRLALMALVETEPVTAAGAAALLAFVKEEMETGEMDWHPTALATIITSLNAIDARTRMAA